MRIVWMFLLSMLVISCGQQEYTVEDELPRYYQEILEHNNIGEPFNNKGFTFIRENETRGFTEYIKIDETRYFQEVMILMNNDQNFNTVFIHKEPINSGSFGEIEVHFQDFKTRISQELGPFKPLRPNEWNNAWIYEIADPSENSLAAISMQLDRDDSHYLFVVIYMSKGFLEDNREIFR